MFYFTISLNKLLREPAQLKKFLNTVNLKKQRSESALGDVLDVFTEAEEGYNEDARIYGANTEDDALLSMFEQQNETDDVFNFGGESDETNKKSESEEI